MNVGRMVTVKVPTYVVVLAVAILLFALSSSVWVPELLAMLTTVLAAILAAVSVLLFCVWLTQRQDIRQRNGGHTFDEGAAPGARSSADDA